MKRFILPLLLLGLCISLVQAQNSKVTVSGTIWDSASNTPNEQATGQINL